MQAAITVDGVTTGVPLTAGQYRLTATGTFGSGTLSVEECETVGGTYIPVGSSTTQLATLSAAGGIGFYATSGWFYHVRMAGSTSPSVVWSINAVMGKGAGQP